MKNYRDSIVPQMHVHKHVFNETGPWQVDEWSNDRIVLQSHATDDAALIVTGNFGSKEEKYEYALQLAARMNVGLQLVPPGFFDIERRYRDKTPRPDVYKPENL